MDITICNSTDCPCSKLATRSRRNYCILRQSDTLQKFPQVYKVIMPFINGIIMDGCYLQKCNDCDKSYGGVPLKLLNILKNIPFSISGAEYTVACCIVYGISKLKNSINNTNVVEDLATAYSATESIENLTRQPASDQYIFDCIDPFVLLKYPTTGCAMHPINFAKLVIEDIVRYLLNSW